MRKTIYLLIAVMAVATGCHTTFTEPMSTTPPPSTAPIPQQQVTRYPSRQQAKSGRRAATHTPAHRTSQSPKQVQPPPKAPNPTPVQDVNTKTNRELATHETQFDRNDENRNTNIALAAESINGKIVQPGETFSYNETVGPTIERRGYKESIIYVDGEKEKGFGGGVCQVSTTLHNAAEEAGMTIMERHDHSRPVTYAESGDEAATSYGVIDFKFKNEKSHPVQINSTAQNGTIKVTIIAV